METHEHFSSTLCSRNNVLNAALALLREVVLDFALYYPVKKRQPGNAKRKRFVCIKIRNHDRKRRITGNPN